MNYSIYKRNVGLNCDLEREMEKDEKKMTARQLQTIFRSALGLWTLVSWERASMNSDGNDIERDYVHC